MKNKIPFMIGILAFMGLAMTPNFYDPVVEKWAAYLERSTGGDTLSLAPMDTLISYQRITTDATLTDVAANANVMATISASSYTLTLPSPAERFVGKSITVVQMNASGILFLTVDSSSGSSGDFQASNTATDSYAYTPGVWAVHKFTCMDVGSSTLRWVVVF